MNIGVKIANWLKKNVLEDIDAHIDNRVSTTISPALTRIEELVVRNAQEDRMYRINRFHHDYLAGERFSEAEWKTCFETCEEYIRIHNDERYLYVDGACVANAEYLIKVYKSLYVERKEYV